MTLIRPLFSEKSLDLAGHGWFTFVVSRDSHKREIARSVEDQFKVHVVTVRTVRMPGKTKRQGKKRTQVTEMEWKKALVHLKTGEKIDLFAVETPPVAQKK